ncbi:MAG: hypothetical protein JRH20_14250 [Deltaproteobacteria bacterium]|nr:hypothetical protein [Deltaproteobacteria bacterium]
MSKILDHLGLPSLPPQRKTRRLAQGKLYLRVSDADAVEMTVVDLRWQMVLDRLGHDKPALMMRSAALQADSIIRLAVSSSI